MEQQCPITVQFLRCTEVRTLQPAEYLLVMPLHGTVWLDGAQDSPLEAGSVLFRCPGCPAFVRMPAGAGILYALISADFLENTAGIPRCPSAVVFSRDCRLLSEQLAGLFDLQYNRQEPSVLELLTACCRLLQELVRLISAEAFDPVRPDEGSSRGSRMISWIEQNFRQPVQLQDFADAFGLSRQHASTVFHHETGNAFSDFLQNLRLNEAQRLLSSTQKSVAEISEESGFPNTRSFYLAFQRRSGMTPKEWRQQHPPAVTDAPEAAQQDVLTASRLLQEHRLLYPKQETSVHITEEIPAETAAPFPPVWRDILNVDISTDCLHPAAQARLADLQQQMHFSYVRLSNLIDPDLVEFFPDTRKHRFTKFIQLISFFRSIGLTPMLALGSSWKIFSTSCLLESGYSTAMEDWLVLLRGLLQTSIRHWGADWVRTWRFEFSMPLELYGSEDPAVFLDLFASSLQILQELLPGAQAGGPAMPVDNLHMPLWRAWFQAVSARHLPVSFVSVELWAEHTMQFDQLSGQFQEALRTCRITALENADSALVLQKVQQIRDMMQQYGLMEQKLYVSALGITKYHAMPAQIGGHCAAYLVKCSLDLQPLVDGIGCWKAFNAEAEYSDEYTFLSSGCGLLERNGLHYPAWYAYRFLAALHPFLVFRGLNSCVTTDGAGRYVMLLYNCKNYSPVFCRAWATPEAMEFRSPRMYTSYSAIDEDLSLTGLPAGEYRVDRYLIGDHHGCLAAVIQQMGQIRPDASTNVEYLAGQSLPWQHSGVLDCTGGCLSLHVKLEPDEVMLILIEAENRL